MIVREVRRFIRRGLSLNICSIVVLALGMSASLLTFTLLLALSSLKYSGMQTKGYATIAEETDGGGSTRTTWEQIEKYRNFLSRSYSVAAYGKPIETTLFINGAERPLNVALVSRGFFSVFTQRMLAGRDFTQTEEVTAGRHSIILDATLATKLFRYPQNAIGQPVSINGTYYDVIGVAPLGFNGLFGDNVEAWLPASCVVPLQVTLPHDAHKDPTVWRRLGAFYGLIASGRLSSTALTAEASHALPRDISDAPIHVSQGLTDDPLRDIKLKQWLRLGLLLAFIFTVTSSLNYALLLFARTQHSVEEVRLKRALGAGSGRLTLELMAGPMAIVMIALMTACVLWVGSLHLISNLAGFYGQLALASWRMAVQIVGFQALFSCLITIVIALVPAITILSQDYVPRGGYSSTANRKNGFILQTTVALQLASFISTSIIAGMIVSAVLSMTKQSLGYDPNQLTVVRIGSSTGVISATIGPNHSFPEVSAIESLLGHIKALPGVRSASYTSSPPFAADTNMLTVQQPDSTFSVPRAANAMVVSSEYFHTLKSGVMSGKDFSGSSGVDERGVVINESLAKELWPDQSPVNRLIRLNYPAESGLPSFSETTAVIGVVEDMRPSGPAESPEPLLFKSIKGNPFDDFTPSIIVRGTASDRSLEEAARQEVDALMPGLEVKSSFSVSQRANASILSDKVRAYFALASALAMALVACFGLYGVLNYYVGTRQRELALRICLGAQPWAIRWIVLARAARCAVAAVLLSVPISVILVRLSSGDYWGRFALPIGWVVVLPLACVVIAFAVSLFPANKASSISPSVLLKEE